MRDFVKRLTEIHIYNFTGILQISFPDTINFFKPAIANKKKKRERKMWFTEGKNPADYYVCGIENWKNWGRPPGRILPRPQLKNKDLTRSLHSSSGAISGLLTDLWPTIIGSQPLNYYFFKEWIQERGCLEMTFAISLCNTLWCQGKPTSQFTIQTTNVHLNRHLYLDTAGKKSYFFFHDWHALQKNMKT